MIVPVRSRLTCKAIVPIWLNGLNVITVSPSLSEMTQNAVIDESTEIKLDLTTATTAVAGFSSILFGLFTNLPVALG